MTDKPVSELTFEEALAELDDVVGRLERGDVPLARSISLYERGAKLKVRCEEELKKAEERVATIQLGPDGEPTGLQPETDL